MCGLGSPRLSDSSSDSKSEELRRVRRALGRFARRAPLTSRAFGELHKATQRAGALDARTKELIALAIGVASKCEDCVVYHAADAKAAGATDEQIVEAVEVAVMMGGGPALLYASRVLEVLESAGTLAAAAPSRGKPP